MGRRKAYDALWHPPQGRRKNRPVNPTMHPESLEAGGEEKGVSVIGRGKRTDRHEG